VSAWRAATVMILTRDGSAEVRGYICDDAPGLAVTPDPHYVGVWTVTHIASGRGAPAGSQDAENVMGMALALARLGDWTGDASAVWEDDRLVHAARSLVERAVASEEWQWLERHTDEAVPMRYRRAPHHA